MIHHPSCPQRHLTLTSTCFCGPEAQAEDLLILQSRSVDGMLLDIVAHADRAVVNVCMDAYLASRGQVPQTPVVQRINRALL